MALAAGARIGPYEVVSALGAGGMGEVYRARDSRLGREVAIKVILDVFASDADRIARFQREAKVLASLNHPHIAALYGLEESGGQHYLVMELVEGETLADRLVRGPLPTGETLSIAVQIAEALEAAHEKGVVHRDLKPANVKVTPDDRVKVLDFGLAKAVETEATSSSAANSPTLSMMASQAGIILGTAAYMSPEQAKGLPADHRSDIFAFGAVLFEMLTGRQPFQGDTAPEVLASVLIREPALDRLPADLDPRLVDLVRRCLEKTPKRRWQAIGDVRAELEAALASPRSASTPAQAAPPPRSGWSRVWPSVISAIVVGALAAGAAWTLKPVPPGSVVRFAMTMPSSQRVTGALRETVAISPDGSVIAYVADQRIYLRPIQDLEATPLPATSSGDAVSSPLFSPDGRSLVFYAAGEGTIKRVALGGGAAVTVCPAVNLAGMSWDADGIVFAENAAEGRVVKRVPAGGGVPQVLARFQNNELLDRPQMLPDGETILVTVATNERVGADRWDKARIVAVAEKSGARTLIVDGGADARYLPTGHLVYAVGGVAYAAPFDYRSLKITGDTFSVIEGVRRSAAGVTGIADFSVSLSGTLVYVPGPAGASPGVALAMADEKGALTAVSLAPGVHTSPRASPDGTRIALESTDGRAIFIAVYDRSGAAGLRRITFDANSNSPVWSSDGRRVAFQSRRDGDPGIFAQSADGGGASERLTTPRPGESHLPQSWNGDVLLYDVVKDDSVTLWQVSTKSRKAEPFGAVRSSTETGAVFSPDGRWVAYATTEERATNLFVQPFPANGAKYMLVKSRNYVPHHPIWSPGGSAILYVPSPGILERVSVATQPTFSFGNPEVLPRPLQAGPPASHRLYDMLPDGRILGIVTPGQPGPLAQGEFRVIVNWFEDLRNRARR